jgi:hypothetical protein
MTIALPSASRARSGNSGLFWTAVAIVAPLLVIVSLASGRYEIPLHHVVAILTCVGAAA